jgi:hypothetical protein
VPFLEKNDAQADKANFTRPRRSVGQECPAQIWSLLAALPSVSFGLPGKFP